MHAALLAAEKSAEVANQLPIPPAAYGFIAFGSLLAMLAVAHAFRSVGTRH